MSCDESQLIRVGGGYRNVGKRSTNIRMVIPEPAAARRRLRRNAFGDVLVGVSMCLYWQWRGFEFHWKATSRMEDQAWRIIKACLQVGGLAFTFGTECDLVKRRAFQGAPQLYSNDIASCDVDWCPSTLPATVTGGM